MEEEFARSLAFQDPLIGRLLQDRYRVLRLLGRGGMGVVYLVEHVLIRRKLALKLLHSNLTASEELVQRFHREARAAAAVGNEHIVDVTDMGRLDDGAYYIVLEFLDGSDLGALVAREGPLSIARTLDIGLQICDALADVHSAGILHRDLKPENIVLIKRGRKDDFVKILDFGICKVLTERPLTVTGVALGTPHYMAPEQIEARPEIDARADVYAVGAILFHALTGRTPFITESLPQLLINIWRDPAPNVRSLRPDVPEALATLIARTLEKQPERRFSDSRSLATELTTLAASVGVDRAWASESGVRSQNVLTTDAVRPRRQAGRWRLVLASLAIALSIAVVVGWLASLIASLSSTNVTPARETMTAPAPTAIDVPPSVPAVTLERSVEVAPRTTEAREQSLPAKPRAPARRKKVEPAAPSSTPGHEAEQVPTPREFPEEPARPAAVSPREPLLVPEPAELRRVL